MVAPTGFSAQLGLAEEVTWGTIVAPARHLEFLGESLKNEIARAESKGLRAGRRILLSSQWAPGKSRIAGGVDLEMLTTSQALLWKHMLGAISTTGAGPYVHTAIPGDLTGKGLTIQIGRPDSTGTVRPFTYSGCKVRGWELSAEAGEIATLSLDIVGAAETTATALSTATYAATMAPLVMISGTLTIAGAQLDVMSLTASGDNGLKDDRWRVRGSGVIKEPLENRQRAYTGQVLADFEDLTQYNRFTAGTEAALVITLSNGGTSQVVITQNVRFDGDTPNVSGAEMLELPLSYKAVASGAADSSGISVVITNPDSAP
jgi:hypothetical protein